MAENEDVLDATIPASDSPPEETTAPADQPKTSDADVELGVDAAPAQIDDPATDAETSSLTPTGPVAKADQPPETPTVDFNALRALARDKVDEDYRKLTLHRENQKRIQWFKENTGVDISAELGETPEDQQEPESSGGVWGATKDIGSAVVSPSEWGKVVGGSALHGLDALADISQQFAFKYGGLVYEADQPEGVLGHWHVVDGPEFKRRAEEAIASGAASKPETPNVLGLKDDPKTMTGYLAQGLAQFMWAMALTKGIPAFESVQGASKLEKFLKFTGRAGIADFFGFKGQSGNAADLYKMLPENWQQHAPDMLNALADYMTTKGEDAEITNRLKNATINAVGNVVAEPLMRLFSKGRVASLTPELEAEKQALLQNAQQKGKEGQGAAMPPPGQGAPGGRIAELLGDPNGEPIKVVGAPTAPEPKPTGVVHEGGDVPFDLNHYDPEAEALVSNHKFVLEMKKTPQPQRLIDWIKSEGGIKDVGGDVKASTGDTLIQSNLLHNKSGRNLDDVAVAAWEKGYLPGHTRPDINALLEAIDQDVKQGGVYSSHDQELVSKLEHARLIADELDREGLLSAKDETELRARIAKNREAAGQEMPMFALRAGEGMAAHANELGFTSKLDDTLSSLQPTDTVTAETLQKRGVKQAEIQARGLADLLSEGKGAKVADLQKVAGENPVALKERTYERTPATKKWELSLSGVDGGYFRFDTPEEAQAFANARIAASMPEKKSGLFAKKPAAPVWQREVPMPGGRSLWGIHQASSGVEARIYPAGNETKWSQYSLDPSNPTYRETVLHLPEKIKQDEFGRYPDNETFRQGHFSEPNVVAHARTQVLTDAQGRKVFNIDELQSDWGQKLRDAGVRDEAKIAELRKRQAAARQGADEILQKFMDGLKEGDRAKTSRDDAKVRLLKWSHPARGEGMPQRWKALEDQADLLHAELRTAEAATPGHPLVNTTDQWTSTALRRLIRQAVESNADAISITPGKVQADRYPGGAGEAKRAGGMQKTYDEMYPRTLAKLLQKMDPSIKAEVKPLNGTKGPITSDREGVHNPTGWENTAPHQEPIKGSPPIQFTTFPITDKVRQAVAQGQPMFALTHDAAWGHAAGMLKIGKAVVTNDFVRDATHEALAPVMHIVPKEVPVGALSKMTPLGGGRIRLDFVTRDGQSFSFDSTLKEVRGARALFHPDLRVVGFTRLGTFSGFNKILAAELHHETVHALVALDLIPPADLARFIDHARASRVLNLPASDYQRVIGEKPTAGAGIQIRHVYEDMYHTEPDFESRMDEEGIAILTELDQHQRLKDTMRAPIADILDKIRSGEYLNKGMAPRESRPMFAADMGADTAQARLGLDDTPRAPAEPRLHFNWARFNGPEDVEAMARLLMDKYSSEMIADKGGVRSHAQMVAEADDDAAWNYLLSERPKNEPLGDSMTYALRRIQKASAAKVLELGERAAGGTPEEIYAFNRQVETHRMIQRVVQGVKTATARAQNQWAIPLGSPGQMTDQIKRAIERAGGEAFAREFAAEITVLGGKPGYGAAMENLIQKSAGARSLDMLREYWINAILSGPQTHIVNSVSNSAVTMLSVLERAAAGAIGQFFHPTDGVKMKEAFMMFAGQKAAIKDGLIALAESIRLRENRFGDYGFRGNLGGHLEGFGQQSLFNTAGSQIDHGRTRAISSEAWGQTPGILANAAKNSMVAKAVDMIGSIVNIPGTLMTGADNFFKAVNYRAELWAQAFRQASEEGLSGADLKARVADLIAHPTEDVHMKAVDFARYNTFQQDAGPISQTLMKFRAATDNALGFPLGTLVMPFIATPGNIMKYTFERTPLAPLSAKFRADLMAGGARADMAIAKMGLGSVMMAAAFEMAANGDLTGSGPDNDADAGQRQLLARVGAQPYSLRFLVDSSDPNNPKYRWVAYNRLDPIGGQLAMAAELADIVRNGINNSDEIEEATTALAFSAMQTYLNKSYLSGFATIMAAMQNPERYSESYVQRTVSALIPNLVATATKVEDPVMRQTSDMLSALKERTMGRDQLPAKLDFWGRERTYQSGLGGLYDAISPFYSKTNDKAEPADRAFFKLGEFPKNPTTIRVGEMTVPLRNEPQALHDFIKLTAATPASALLQANADSMDKDAAERARLQDFGDDNLRETLNKIVTGKSDSEMGQRYQDAEDNEKKYNVLSLVISAYRAAAKVQILREHPELTQTAALKGAAKTRPQGPPPF